MRRAIAFCGVAVFGIVPMYAKVDQRDARRSEAYRACVTYLHDNAKNPDAFKADPEYTHKLANWMTAYRGGKNQVIIYMGAWGMNSFGAVLRHSYTCWAGCPPDKPCMADGAVEDQDQ